MSRTIAYSGCWFTFLTVAAFNWSPIPFSLYNLGSCRLEWRHGKQELFFFQWERPKDSTSSGRSHSWGFQWLIFSRHWTQNPIEPIVTLAEQWHLLQSAHCPQLGSNQSQQLEWAHSRQEGVQLSRHLGRSCFTHRVWLPNATHKTWEEPRWEFNTNSVKVRREGNCKSSGSTEF